MFCSKCGAELNGECVFCHTCGYKIMQEPVGCDAHGTPEIIKEPEPVKEPKPVPEEIYRAIEALEAPLPPEQRTVTIIGRKEKEYFGFPALVFCLTVIGLLSIACGVLAVLYFGGV